MNHLTPEKRRAKAQVIRQWLVENRRWLLFCALPLLFLEVFLYFPTWKWLIATWSHDKPYSHGFFVPFIFLYLVWLKREQLRRIPVRPAWLSSGLILFASCFLLLIGRVGAIIQLEVISLYFFIPGVILFVWGRQTLKALWFAVFFLQFMIPWIDPFLKYVYPLFRRVAATLGTWFLSFHYPVMQDGTFIYLPNITLSVIDACSGINFFISVTAVGVLLAYLTQKSWKRVFVVLLAGVAVTVFANGVRVALAGVMGQKYGAGMLHGPGHIFRGWFVAQFGWILIFFINWLVARIPHPAGCYLYERWQEEATLQHGDMVKACPENRLSPQILIAFVFLSCFGVFLNFIAPPVAISMRDTPTSFPLQIAKWQGQDVQWLPSRKFFPGADSEILRRYQTSSGKFVYLYIGYYPVQRDNARLISYHDRPIFKDKKNIRLDIVPPMRVGLSTTNVDQVQYQVVSWYQFADGTLVDKRKVKVKGVVDALIHRRNNGAVVLVASSVVATGNKSHGEEVNPALVDFTRLAVPLIQNMLRVSK